MIILELIHSYKKKKSKYKIAVRKKKEAKNNQNRKIQTITLRERKIKKDVVVFKRKIKSFYQEIFLIFQLI